MTILFTPQNGAETADAGGGDRLGTQSWGLPLYTIYWGSWWTNTSDGQTLQTQIQNSLNSMFYFSAGENSVKARNLQANPNCVLCPGGADEAVIVEGVAERLVDKKLQARVAQVYFEKYEWDLSELNQPIFVLRPETVFGQIEKTFSQTATRWTFDKPVQDDSD